MSTTKRPREAERLAGGHGKRGPKKGFQKDLAARRRQEAEAAVALNRRAEAAADARTDSALAVLADLALCVKSARELIARHKVEQITSVLRVQDRQNPAMLAGHALRAHAFSRGIARSQLEGMTDEKIREQLQYVTYRQYEEAEAA